MGIEEKIIGIILNKEVIEIIDITVTPTYFKIYTNTKLFIVHTNKHHIKFESGFYSNRNYDYDYKEPYNFTKIIYPFFEVDYINFFYYPRELEQTFKTFINREILIEELIDSSNHNFVN